MKRYIYLLGVLLLVCNNIRGQGGGFNPNNPPEPNAQYNLVLQASPNGAGSFSGSGKYAAGSSVWVYAYNNTGFRFISWKENETVISTSSSFNYVMPAANATLTAVFEYDPGSPGEPNPTPLKYVLNLLAQPAVAGSFNISSGNRYEEGSSVYLYAYTNSGFKFKEWRDGNTVLSTNRNYYYTMPSENKTVTAVYYYDPDSPTEPNTPADTEHGLIALNQSGDAGQTITFPLYLLNHNIDVHSLEFDITFPEGAVVNHNGAFLTSRGNGQTISADSRGSNGFHYSIAGESGESFTGSNGILLQIPVTLSTQWTPNEIYPVKIENVQIGTPGGTVASTGKAGSLSINPVADYKVLAGFHSNKFLNRVYFVNLSSETATQFKWNFGDGTTSVEREPLHVYETSGSYNVQLIASNTQEADTVTAGIEIAAENTWDISGNLSLNKHKKDLKNFTSAGEMFRLLSRANLSGNITINVESGETFECDLSAEMRNMLTILTNKLAEKNLILIFRKDGESNEPVISFTGTVNAESAQAAAQLGWYIELNGVIMKILNMPVDIRQIFSYTPQRICSGSTSAPVDFTRIGSAFTYNWALISAPASVSGYTVSGSGIIPSATLTTTSSTADSLIYKVSILSPSPLVELYSFEYKIVVMPTMQGELTLLSPAANQMLSSSEVTFTWSEIPNASYYEIKIWDEYDDEPATAMATNIKTASYQISAYFQYGKKYNCKVIAVNECKRIESAAVSFSIRYLPNLHVTAVEAPATVNTGTEAAIIFCVRNDGPGATLPAEHWYDRVSLIKDMKTPNSNVHWLSEKQNKAALAPGEFYRDTVKIKIPERITGNWYVVVTSDMANILSVDWSPVNNTVPLPYTPDKSGTPYPYLQVQTSAAGNLVPEEKETVTMTDNFFYTATDVKISKLPDLQSVSIEIPASVTEIQKFTVKATLTNRGDTVLSGKTWTDGIWQSKAPDFNTSTASLVASFVNSARTLETGESYTATFELTAPVDSTVNYYYFVTADLNDDIYESDEINNRIRSGEVLVLPAMINETDYANLIRIFNEFGGESWTNKWRIVSNRIGDYWRGVAFHEGWVTAISLASNNLTGEMSDVFLRFPYLNTLNLNNNQLSGSLTSLLAGESLPDSLVSLDLGRNQLLGKIPATIARLEKLEELNVSYNRLSEIESALSQKIVRLDIQSQTLPSDSIALSPQPALNVPSIARYNHSNGSFENYPSYSLYRNNDRLLRYVHNGTNYVWQLNQYYPKDFVWYSEPEYEFSLVQESGLAQGSTGKLKLGFGKGDANIDRQTDILDVQHSLNYIFSEHVSAFNFTAADTYKDNAITVQDLVKTIDVIFDAEHSGESPLRSENFSDNRLFIHDGKLYIHNEQAISVMDVSLQGISEKEILPLPSDTEFQFVFRDSENGTRFIVFSPTGNYFPPGSTVLAELSGNDATILHATAANPAAEQVPLKIGSSVTGIASLKADEISAFAVGRSIYYHLPNNAILVSASLYSIQGMIVGKQEFGVSQPEQQRLDFNLRQSGVYLLNLTVKSNHRVFSKNIKLTVTK